VRVVTNALKVGCGAVLRVDRAVVGTEYGLPRLPLRFSFPMGCTGMTQRMSMAEPLEAGQVGRRAAKVPAAV